MLRIAEEIRIAIEQQQPVVALESTIVAHGMPWPDNIKLALRLEKTVRDSGAIPATIAVANGKMLVGLTSVEIEQVAKGGAMKIGTREIPFALQQRRLAATTVSATMHIAAMAGIRVFATGGIGGVHRGANSTFDISADLHELSHTSVCVVSAGAKAILDLAATVEYLETFAIPVIGFKCNEFPAFYSRSTGVPLSMRLDSATDIAQFIDTKWKCGLNGGVLVANPIPETFEIPNAEIEPAISSAIIDAENAGVSGKALTPFLLKRIGEITDGKAQLANEQLVLSNARLASAISIELTGIDSINT